MPELPEVETMRRGLLPIVGSKIVRVEFPVIPYRPIQIDPSPEGLSAGCVGRQIRSVRRIAKRVLVDLDTGNSIVMQPKMAGIAMLHDVPSEQHTRVVFHLDGNTSVDRFVYWDRRGLGNVCLWSVEQVDHYLGPSKLGPDASIVGLDLFCDRLKVSTRAVKIALLDQSIICGIGNLYAAEILFEARVNPHVRCTDLSRTQLQRMHAATLRILNEAIENEGSTLKDGTYRNAINGEGGYQSRHRVYDREGELCFGCQKKPIERVVQGQRSTFFCPNCQRVKAGKR